MRRNYLTPADRPRRGAAAVEFALIAPVFVALIVGVLDTLTAMHGMSLMNQALREGGRLAATDWSAVTPDGVSPNQKVEQDIRNFLDAAGMNTSTLTIAITYAEGSKQGQPFKLGGADSYHQLFQIRAHLPNSPTNFFTSSITQGQGLSARVVFRAGREQSRD